MSLNKKALGASAAVVALSTFVPNPFFMGDALAVATASDSVKIQAKVSNPLGVNSAAALNFGTFAPNVAGGSLTFNQAGTTINSGVLINTGVLGSVSFTAPKGAVFTISIPDFAGVSDVIKTAGAGGATSSKTMTVQSLKFVTTNVTKLEFKAGASPDWTATKSSNTEQAVINTGTVGKATIGGKLLFDGTQLPATYTGTFTVAITF